MSQPTSPAPLGAPPPGVADVLAGDQPSWPITIGVALPIPEPFLSELGAYRERFGDPLAHAIVAHITLVPPTPVSDAEHLAAILAHLSAQAGQLEPFELVLEGTGTFRPVSQVVFVPIVVGAEEVRTAEARIRRGPLDRTLNFPYHPHVTVAHDLDQAWLDQAEKVLAGYRAAFDVDRLGLFVQGANGMWRQAVEVPFGPPARDPRRYSSHPVTIEVLDPARFGALCDRLGMLLADAVGTGAGVNFLLPFSAEDGGAWWRAQTDEVAQGQRIVLIARDGDEVVGTISMSPAQAQNQPHRVEFSKLIVHSADRRRGVATRLLAAAESQARARGFTLITLDCVAGGPEEEFYRGLGYVAVGTIPGYALAPTGEPEAATFLYLALR
ncbi:MAG: GNAT family N-acetyltransferase [Candidatus Nanopelagicales bacterium]